MGQWDAKLKGAGFVNIIVKVKVSPLQATKALRVGRGIALPFLRPRHWRWGWGVSTTPRPLYPRERPGTHCTGGWVGPRAGRAENLDPTVIRPPDRPARSKSLYRLSYPGRQHYCNCNKLCVFVGLPSENARNVKYKIYSAFTLAHLTKASRLCWNFRCHITVHWAITFFIETNKCT